MRERRRAEEERRKIEDQMLQVQKLESLGVLAGGIAHDFNNLLMGILGNAGLALEIMSPVSPIREMMEEIDKAGQRAADLSRQMLAYSGKGNFLVQAIDLGEVVNEMSHLLAGSISKNAIIKYDLASDLPSIKADATQIRQVVMNLITNASEAMDEEVGVINISSGVKECDRNYFENTYLDEGQSEGKYVYMKITDTGCGMDEDTKAKLFDPFFTTKFTGRGLGMAATLGIVRGHKGAIKVDSEVGKGTTFTVLFPASDQPVEHSKEKSSPTEDWQGTGTVLLVDDEEMVRRAAQRIIEKQGFKVLVACDGVEAMEVYSENADEITCVILDLTMPRMNGEDAFRKLRDIRSDVKVIMSSGFNEQEISKRFAGEDVTGFIQKPYRIAQLRDKLREVLG